MKMGFGLHLPLHGQYSYRDVEKAALTADRLGIRSLWVGDHFFLPIRSYERIGGEAAKPDKLEAWPVLAALASRTSRITLGTRVSPVPFYLPGRLAKIVATVDVISTGRAVLGVGAGWHREEAVSYGLGWLPLQERIDQMFEGLEVITRLWTQDRATYTGKYFHVENAPCYPKPVQKPTPPVFFGGNASRILYAAAVGSGWLPLTDTPLERLGSWVERIFAAAAKAGRQRESVMVGASLTYPGGTGERPEDWVRTVRKLGSIGVTQTILDLSQMAMSPEAGLDLLERFAGCLVSAFA